MAEKKHSLLQELENYVPPKSYPVRLRTHGERVFTAVKKLMIDIEQNCDKETADDLKKRFFNSIKSNNFRKFDLGVDKLEEKTKGKKDEQ
jgi:hypothetical protein